MALTVPIAPLTNPGSTYKLEISITRAFLARWITGSSPPASSEVPLAPL